MKNNAYIYICLIGLFTAFGVISMLVYFTKANNKYLLKKKLALGAVIIGLTAVTNGCAPLVTCYDVALSPVVICTDSVNNDGMIILHQGDQTINFDCQYLYYQDVSFKISNDTNDIFSGDCVKTVTDSSTTLLINTPRDLNVGNYKLKLYYLRAIELDENSSPFSLFNLKVLN